MRLLAWAAALSRSSSKFLNCKCDNRQSGEAIAAADPSPSLDEIHRWSELKASQLRKESAAYLFARKNEPNLSQVECRAR